MKIITPKFEIIEQQYNDKNLLTDMFKHIEICGRTCYKSEDKITEDSYKRFVSMLTNSNHGAMLEHGTVYLSINLGTPIDDSEYLSKTEIIQFFKANKYSVVINKKLSKTVISNIDGNDKEITVTINMYYITTNWRVLVEADKTDNSILKWMTPPTENHEKRYTVRFTYHLGVARDVNRHRVQSVGEESTRYCNYSKSKFGKELNIIEPVWFTDEDKYTIRHPEITFKDMCKKIAQGLDHNTLSQSEYWMFANMACEYAYIMNTTAFGDNNWSAQKASLMLPLDTKTESIHTAFASDWKHFCDLRALGLTGAPRPSAKEVAWPLMEYFLEHKIITLDEKSSNKYFEIKKKYPNIIDYIKI